jgi:hypothetical protein
MWHRLCFATQKKNKISHIVDSKLSCPVYEAHDLSGFPLNEFQCCTEIISHTVALRATIVWVSDSWVGPWQLGEAGMAHSIVPSHRSVPNTAGHETPPVYHRDTHGPGL